MSLQDSFMCFPSCIITHPMAGGIRHKYHSKCLPSMCVCVCVCVLEGRGASSQREGEMSIKHQCPCSPNEQIESRGYMI